MTAIKNYHTDFLFLKRTSFWAVVGWTVLCFLSAYWSVATEKEIVLDLARKEAITVFNKDQAFRFWATNHGGVYVPVTELTPPNPNLSHIPDRDIVTPEGKNLTLMNPAYMLRQVINQYGDLYKIEGKITSLKLLNIINEPDAWERQALQVFDDGVEEVFEVELVEDVPFLRLMRPMYTLEGCMKCHESQGYNVGDVRGGVSVSIPMLPYYKMSYRAILKIYFTNTFFWLAGVLVVVFIFFRGKSRIIERRAAETELYESSEKIKLFAYSVSHDLKNPAIVLHGITKLLIKNYRNNLNEKGALYCDRILKSSDHIISLVEQINLYMSSKERPIVLERVNAEDIFQAIRQEYSDQLSIRGIKWLESKLDIEIRADRLALLRVFRNLIDNTLKYGGDDLSTIEISYNESDEAHIFSVKDDGVGLDPDDCKKIFDPFKRSKTVSEVEGSGLGLAIVREIAELHNGKVWGESDGKNGITFYFAIAKNL